MPLFYAEPLLGRRLPASMEMLYTLVIISHRSVCDPHQVDTVSLTPWGESPISLPSDSAPSKLICYALEF